MSYTHRHTHKHHFLLPGYLRKSVFLLLILIELPRNQIWVLWICVQLSSWHRAPKTLVTSWVIEASFVIIFGLCSWFLTQELLILLEFSEWQGWEEHLLLFTTSLFLPRLSYGSKVTPGGWELVTIGTNYAIRELEPPGLCPNLWDCLLYTSDAADDWLVV